VPSSTEHLQSPSTTQSSYTVSDEPQHIISVHFLLWTLEITMNNLVGV